MTPYARKMSVIEAKLKDKDLSGVEVGTVEKYQGGEKRYNGYLNGKDI